ncbi:hypothetical protein K505DRAFT_360925 [Melanomma pulvis-pyrius CBS 109.77]|uniref:Uncharacterized protein n=1 Tax=Melanomma pulvis-pyrius CBS 109.77 TaxID=1314802 RepID=A0A6A6XEY7_9PLEO|nr:hypothetical protein K505DRAFT_360925 [Melanomma pulvis-pyrius CBS 109.77]
MRWFWERILSSQRGSKAWKPKWLFASVAAALGPLLDLPEAGSAGYWHVVGTSLAFRGGDLGMCLDAGGVEWLRTTTWTRSLESEMADGTGLDALIADWRAGGRGSAILFCGYDGSSASFQNPLQPGRGSLGSAWPRRGRRKKA